MHSADTPRSWPRWRRSASGGCSCTSGPTAATTCGSTRASALPASKWATKPATRPTCGSAWSRNSSGIARPRQKSPRPPRSSRARETGDPAGRYHDPRGGAIDDRRTRERASPVDGDPGPHRGAFGGAASHGREHRIVLHAATELRMGRDGDAVLADIREQSSEIALGALPAPVRPLGRIRPPRDRRIVAFLPESPVRGTSAVPARHPNAYGGR